MRYDKAAISNVARQLKAKSSGLSSIQTKLSNVSPTKCNQDFYSKRRALVKRIQNVQAEINGLSTDIEAAAKKMSSDDARNADYIRQVFNNRASNALFREGVFGQGATGLIGAGLFGGSMSFSAMALNRKAVASLGEPTSTSLSWAKVWNAFKSGASNVGTWTKERLNDIKDWGNSAKDYVWKSITKFVLGDYDDENITVLSFLGNIVASIFNVDLPLDVRDLIYDIQHWGEGDYFGVYFVLDVVAILPVIGALKNLKYVDDIADGTKDLGVIIEGVSDAGKTIDNIGDATDDIKDLGKAVDNAGEAFDTKGVLKSGSKSITVSQDKIQHSVLGEFNSNGRLINGGHGQANINFLNQNNIDYNIVKVYDNGVRVGNIPSHKNKFKRTGTGQAWFPESWTEIDIKNAGEYIANIPENVNVPDGTWVVLEYK